MFKRTEVALIFASAACFFSAGEAWAQPASLGSVSNASQAVIQVSWTQGLGAKIDQTLSAGTSGLVGKRFSAQDLAGMLQSLTDRLRQAGYLVGQVGIRPADLQQFQSSGVLLLTVLPGKVGAVRVTDNQSLVNSERLQITALHAVCPEGVGDNCVLTSDRLERMVLLLQDLPGLKPHVPSLTPEGVAPGQTAIEIGADTDPNARLFSGGVSVNDFGYPASGLYQAGVTGVLTNGLGFGDVLSIAANVSEKGTWTGSFGDSAPIGYDGLRFDTSYARSQFTLPSVTSVGKADSVLAGLVYPMVRGLDGNWNLGLDGFWSKSHQSVTGFSAFASRTLYGGRISLLGDSGDRSFTAGADFWSASLVYSHGWVEQDLGGVTDPTGVIGNYDKVLLNATAREYLADNNFYLLANLRGQYADRNLDGSEKFSIGGPTGIRGYRGDEGSMDEFGVLTLELRRMFDLSDGDKLAPGVLFDLGGGDYVHHTYASWQSNLGFLDTTLPNSRAFESAGLGIDYHANTGAILSFSWSHALPGSPVSLNHPSDENQFWFSGGIRF